ncbi:MAG: hypothetical protein AB1589_38295 [Cyanobacteriota bacterium]
MPEYTVVVKIPNAGNKEISCSINLIDSYEDYPEDYFRLDTNLSSLRETLQVRAARQVGDAHLKRLIDEWIRDIKEGRRRTIITLDLSSECIVSLNQTPIQTKSIPTTKPTSEYRPPVKPPQFPHSTTSIGSSSSNTLLTNQAEPKNQSLKTQEEEKTTSEVWAADNKHDF